MKKFLSFIIGAFLGFVFSGVLIVFIFLLGPLLLTSLLGEGVALKIFETAGNRAIYYPFAMGAATLAGGLVSLFEGRYLWIKSLAWSVMSYLALIIPSYIIIALIEPPLRLVGRHDVLLEGNGGGIFFPLPTLLGLVFLFIFSALLLRPFSSLRDKFREGNRYAWGFTLSFILTILVLAVTWAVPFYSILTPIIAIPGGFMVSHILGKFGNKINQEKTL